jgi:MFS transporter, ACS family, hexuronate transporter
LILWLKFYRRPQDYVKVSLEELAIIESDPQAGESINSEPKITWGRLLRIRETWAYAGARFLIDPIWWMFLFWLPDFFAKRHHLDLEHFGPPLVIVYLVSDLGSIFGGWCSSRLIRRGLTVNRSRKLTMLMAAVVVIPVAFAMYAENLWLAVLLVGLATAGHQAFSTNLYTFPSDVFPKLAVASVVGIGGTAGAVGGMLMAKYAGWVLDNIGSYTPIFVVAGCVYLVALALLQLLSPRMKEVMVPGAR